MAWQSFLFEVRTGVLTHEVHLESHGWETRLNGYGSGQSTIIVAGEVAPAAGWDAATTPWRTGIVSMWDGEPVYAGVIEERDEPTLGVRITITHAEVWKLLGRRYLWGVDDYVGDATRVGVNLTRRGLVMLLLEWTAVTGSPSPRWSLPVSVPALESGTLSRTWRSYRFDKGMDLVQDILDEDGGPDVYLRPRLTSSGTLEWRAEIGSPRVPGVAVDWQSGPAESVVDGLSISQNARDQLTGGFAQGEGAGEAMLVGKGTTSLALDLPVMDLAQAAKNMDTQAQLDAYAQGLTDQRAQLQTQYDFSVVGDALDRGIRPGARPRLRIEGSVLSPSTDWRAVYVVSMGGNLSESVRMGVQAL